MTKILVGNFPSKALTMRAIGVENKEEAKIHIGYDYGDKLKAVLEGALSSFFLSLIVHDEIYISFGDLYVLVDKLGAVDTIKLLEAKIIKLVNADFGNAIWEFESKPGRLSLGGLRQELSAMEHLEREVSLNKNIKSADKPFLLQYADNAIVGVSSEFGKLKERELKNDLVKNTFAPIGLETTSLDDVRPQDALKLLRLADTTDLLLLQHSLGIESIVQDGFVKQYMDIKLGPLVSEMHKDTLTTFSKVTSLKGIPDIYKLYKHGTIDMDSIMSCRASLNGGLFRQWYASTDYDENTVLSLLIQKGVKESVLRKLARIVYPNLIGIINPIAGVAAEVVDSFIVGKLLEGWSPSLFLDDVLKNSVDRQIAIAEESQKRKEIIARFGKVDRNALCPCQSGKKFKNCHGA